MQLIIYCIISYMLLAAMGMAIANRKVNARIKKERWVKYFFYILITSVVITFIIVKVFYILAAVIIILGLVEIIRAIKRKKNIDSFIVVTIYLIISVGLLGFSLQYPYQFQLSIYLQVLSFDAFSQITGQLLGRHSLLPHISPSKTIEGLVGGIIFCFLASLLTTRWLNIAVSLSFVIGLVTALTAFTGDISASYLKRKAEIKDYGKLLPGQGGILDRFDSLLMTGCCYFLLALFNLFK